MAAELEQRLVELESRLAFQELALGELSDALAVARTEAAQHAQRLDRVLDLVNELRPAGLVAPGEEPPPPHY